jgi:hypothetical protein
MRVNKYADDCLSSHHTLSAQQAYLRASNYYRGAEFFLHENPDDSRTIKTWENSVESFNNASKSFPSILSLSKYLMKELHCRNIFIQHLHHHNSLIKIKITVTKRVMKMVTPITIPNLR